MSNSQPLSRAEILQANIAGYREELVKNNQYIKDLEVSISIMQFKIFQYKSICDDIKQKYSADDRELAMLDGRLSKATKQSTPKPKTKSAIIENMTKEQVRDLILKLSNKIQKLEEDEDA